MRVRAVAALSDIAGSVAPMGFRMRKSIRIAPGIRLNVSAKSLGISAGVRGAHVSMNSRTGVRTTVGLPGTGMSYTRTQSPHSSPHTAPTRSRTHQVTPPESPPRPQVKRPGLFAPHWHKELFAALEQGHTTGLEQIAVKHPESRNTCMLLEALTHSTGPGSDQRAEQMLGELWGNGYDPAADEFLHTYAPESSTEIRLTPVLTAHLPLSRDTIGLALGELLQDIGNLAGAVEVVEGVTPSTVAAVSLAELYAQAARWNDIVQLTDGIANDDDFSTYLLIQRGVAFRQLGFHDASRESLRAALAPRSRTPALRHLALSERALTYRAEGKLSMARRDLERILADDSDYPGVREMIAELG